MALQRGHALHCEKSRYVSDVKLSSQDCSSDGTDEALRSGVQLSRGLRDRSGTSGVGIMSLRSAWFNLETVTLRTSCEGFAAWAVCHDGCQGSWEVLVSHLGTV